MKGNILVKNMQAQILRKKECQGLTKFDAIYKMYLVEQRFEFLQFEL